MSDRILWGQIFAVLLIVLAAVWTATQSTAEALGFQAALGAPWFRIGDYPVYPPPAFFWWWFAFDAYAPPIFYRGAAIAASGGLLSVVVAISMSVWRARERRRAETYGSARWAQEREIRAANMLGPDGVILGRMAGTYLRHDGAEHVLCFAPTRSGKGVGLVVPTLLTWPGSCIVHDIKGENWQLTAGFRAKHGRVLLFDPTNPASAAYNPLLEVPGGIGTIHAGSAIGALRRMEQLIQEAVITVPRALLAETIDLVAVLVRDGAGRRLAELARVDGLDASTGHYRITPLFTPEGD